MAKPYFIHPRFPFPIHPTGNLGPLLYKNQVLFEGQQLVSANGTCWAALGGEDVFTVYRGPVGYSSSGKVWDLPLAVGGGLGQSEGAPLQDLGLIMQGDGNLVVYNNYSGNHKALWASGTNRSVTPHSYRATLSDLGSIVVTNAAQSDIPLWSSPPDPVVDFEIETYQYNLAAASILANAPEVVFTEPVVNTSTAPLTNTYTHTRYSSHR